MALTILSVGFPFAPVTADPAGGSEQVLAAIDHALVDVGHQSIVIAPDGSETSGELRTIPAVSGPIEAAQRAITHAAVRARIAEVIRDERPDVVHLHGLDFDDYIPATGPAVLATLHLPLDWYPGNALRPSRPRTWLQPVSDDQANRAPSGVTLTAPIGNGVDMALYEPSAKQDYALMLGRIAPEKGFHDAIDAAKAAGVSLIVAGQVFPYAAHRQYFDIEVAPRLDAKRRFVGPVSGAAKRALLAGARCVLLPSTAPETSSLVAMESLASGTPVIAYRSGALPSIVEDGRTGFIVDDVPGMAAAIGRIDTVDPAVCRSVAVERFPLRRTTDAYIDLYRRIAGMTANDAILARWTAGEISREIALAQMLLTGSVPDAATLPAPIAELARAQADRLDALAALARQGFDAGTAEATATLFDRLAVTAPDAGVAFYTLGDPALMAAAIEELVAVIRAWAPTAGRDILDFGCGTGRIAVALAPDAGSIVGVDVSPGMIEAARLRAAGVTNVEYRVGNGHALPCADAAFDLVLAIDCIPFLVQAGEAALDAHIAEFARVLRPGGSLMVFNWSYRGDTALDIADAYRLGERHGLVVLAAGEAPFAIWDGRGFHLQRR